MICRCTSFVPPPKRVAGAPRQRSSKSPPRGATGPLAPCRAPSQPSRSIARLLTRSFMSVDQTFVIEASIVGVWPPSMIAALVVASALAIS